MVKNFDDNQKKLIPQDLRNHPPIVPPKSGVHRSASPISGRFGGTGENWTFLPQAWGARGAKGQYLRKSCSDPLYIANLTVFK